MKEFFKPLIYITESRGKVHATRYIINTVVQNAFCEREISKWYSDTVVVDVSSFVFRI